MPGQEIPLLPLNTVLFPGGLLPLRIFEQRYLSMVKDCARSNTGFGVCLIADGSETGKPASPHPIGTLAQITDWYTMADGLLGVTVEGGQRFCARESHADNRGLTHALVDWLPDPGPQPLAVEYSLLAHMLERLMDRMAPRYPDYTPALLEDAVWVGYRMAELLPLALPEKQHLLELADPHQRLQRLLELIPAFLDS